MISIVKHLNFEYLKIGIQDYINHLCFSTSAATHLLRELIHCIENHIFRHTSLSHNHLQLDFKKRGILYRVSLNL